jgi:hypothetical protein
VKRISLHPSLICFSTCYQDVRLSSSTFLKSHLQNMISLGLVPSFLELAYQLKNNDHSAEFCDVILELVDLHPNSVPLDSRLLSFLDSFVRSAFLPYGPKTITHMCRGLSRIAQTVDLQLLVDTNLLSTLFTLDSSSSSAGSLISLIEDCVKNDRTDLLQHLFVVGLIPSLRRRKIVLNLNPAS